MADFNTPVTKNSYSVPAVDQAIRVLLCLSKCDSEPLSLTDICNEVGIHRSKAFSILNTLQDYGLARKFPNRKGYMLGTGLLTLTGKMLENLSLPRLVEPILNDLAKKSSATVDLGVVAEDKTYVVAQYLGAPGIGISSPIGYMMPVTYGAHGKIIAACLPQAELDALLRQPELYFYGAPEKFKLERFLDEITQCRLTGYAMETGDIVPGVNVVAAPLLDKNRQPIGYVTIAGFFSEEDSRRLGPMAVETVRRIAHETDNLNTWKKAGSGIEIDPPVGD
jgi:DNA-binding IclR family transcriptional regulator